MAPVIVPFTFGEDAAYPGDSNAVNCMVMKGDLPLDIYWTFNGQPLRHSELGVSILRMKPRLSSLSIDSLDSTHRGTFTCVAINAAGLTNSTADLVINGGQKNHNQLYSLVFTFHFLSSFLLSSNDVT